MPKLILTFKTQEDLDAWYGAYSDGGGQDAIYDCVADNDDIDFDIFEMPDIEEVQ